MLIDFLFCFLLLVLTKDINSKSSQHYLVQHTKNKINKSLNNKINWREDQLQNLMFPGAVAQKKEEIKELQQLQKKINQL